MKAKLFWLAVAALVCVGAWAQDGPPPPAKGSALAVQAFPGQAWTSLGDSSPVEHGNIQSEIYAEQGVTVFSAQGGSFTFTPYTALEFSNDTYGFAWNNKVIVRAGGKFNKLFRHGIVSVGGGYAYENRYKNDPNIDVNLLNGTHALPASAGAAIGYVQGWFGWQPVADRRSRYPGSLWFAAGNIEPVEHGNVIGMGNVQQGFVMARLGRVILIPYAELRLSGDLQGYDWENKAAGGGGIKVAVPRGNAYTEIGAGVRHESRFLSGLSASGVYVFLNTSFSWALFHKKGN